VAIENEKAAVNRTAYRAGDIAGQEGMPSGRWEEVFQGINQLIMILDPEHVILEANRAVQEATGLSGEELQGETCYQVFHGADEPPPGCPLVALLASGRPETSEMDVEVFGRMFLVSVTPLFDDRGRLERIVHVATDITERKQAEEQLSTEMDKARQYLDVAGVMLIALDAHGEITLINTKGCEILGADQKEILGKNWFDAFLPKRLVEEVRSVYDKSMKGEIEQVEYYENPIRTKTGEERIIAWHNALLRDASGKIIGLLSSGEDITERKRAEEALAHERDLLQALMDNMPDTIYFKDTASRFTRINKAQAQALGVRDPQEVTGKTDSDFFADEHARAAYADEQKMVETGEALIAKEEKVRRADGTFHWVSATKVPIKDAAGHVTGIVGISRDITERKQAEEALRESEEQYRTTLNSMDSCIHVIDEDFRIILFNEAFERFNKKLGLTTKALGLPLSEVFPFLTENVYDEYRRVFENGETIVTEDKYEFESPKDPIRYTDFVKEVEDNKDMALFGHITGPYGLLWHTRGPEQSFYDIAEDPNFVRALVEKLTEGMIEIGLQQLERSKGLLLGIWIADDIAYNKGLMFSPETYYKLFWPSLRRMCESFKKRGAKIIYHSDGDIREAIDMLIEAGVDAINPLEVRAGMDVVKLKEKYEGRLSFIGNIDNTGTLRTGTKQDIEKEVIRKLKAAKGGGYIIGSSHSIGPDVPIENYEYFLQIVRGDAK